MSSPASTPASPPVYLLPGWQNSDPEHWQSRWERELSHCRIEQSDWDWPRRGDWMARLDEVLLNDARLLQTPALLVAHSLGCQLVAAWAEHSRLTGRVQAALLVAPPDTEREDMPPQLHNWRPVRRGRLPFAALAVVSSDDPYCTPERARGFCADWGAVVHDAGPRGHLNGESGLGDWDEGHALLRALAAGVRLAVPG